MAVFDNITFVNGFDSLIYRLIIECEGITNSEMTVIYNTEGTWKGGRGKDRAWEKKNKVGRVQEG